MRLKKVCTLAVIGALSVGGISAYAQVPEKAASKGELVNQKVAVEINTKEDKESKVDENEAKITAINAFEKYFNEEVDGEKLNSRETDMEGQKNYLVRSSSGFKYTALVNDSSRVLHLQLAHVEPKDESYKDYSYNDAKALVTNFVKTKNIIGEDYTLSTDKGTELNENKENTAYYFYFEYDDNKECLVVVNKGLEKVEQFILLDEINTLG